MIDFVALYVPAKCYGPEYLDHIVDQVARFACPHPYHDAVRWTFLTTATDEACTWRLGVRGDVEARAIPLASPWRLRARWNNEGKPQPYWCFSKLECFRDDLGLTERAVMTDLDNFVVGPLDELLSYDGDFGVRANFPPAVAQLDRGAKWQTSMMLFRPSACHDIWETAREMGGTELAERFPPLHGGGDQAFISWARPQADDLEQLYPGQLASYKWGWLTGTAAERERMRVLYCHGSRKPHEVGWRPE